MQIKIINKILISACILTINNSNYDKIQNIISKNKIQIFVFTLFCGHITNISRCTFQICGNFASFTVKIFNLNICGIISYTGLALPFC